MQDELAPEEPLEIRVDTRPVAVTMRTPGHDRELVAGFLLSEGVIRSAADLADVRPYARNRAGNVMDAFLAEGVGLDLKRLLRHGVTSSSCGLCGKVTLEAVRQQFGAVRSRLAMDASVLGGLPERLLARQEVFRRTGGLHGAALFDEAGELAVVREDVGRHNAVDKVLGWALLQGRFPLTREVLLVSGRVSFEIMQKALAGRLPIVAAVSAPSALAVQFARRNGQTLIGFLRSGRMNVYAGRRRVREA